MSFYQKFEEKDSLVLHDHTLKKAELVAKGMNYLLENRKRVCAGDKYVPIISPLPAVSVLDVGSAEGLVTMDLFKTFSHLDISLTQVNPTVVETDTAQRLLAKYYPKRKIEIISGFFAQVPPKVYDMVVFFAIFHHILHTYPSAVDGVKHLASFIGDIGIIEVPLAHDALLNIWKEKNHNVNYSCLESLDSFARLLETEFSILHTEQLDYDVNKKNSDLYRWAFIVQKKKDAKTPF
jgi:hypothetical protein